MKSLLKIVCVIWASPYSLLGASIGCIGLLFKGQMRFRDGAFEFYEGGTKWFVRHLPLGISTVGMTLGHVILGQTAAGLEMAGEHERVHVRQFERWGPFMGPAYLLASAWIWLRGGDAYRDNPFEVQAYNEAP